MKKRFRDRSEYATGIKRRKLIMDFIRKYSAEKGYPPSLREIGDAVGISCPVALFHLEKLAKSGLIRRDKNINRGIVILKND